MQSNNPWSVRVEAADRRYVVIACNEDRIGDHDYFKELAKILTDENAALFLTWLNNRDISHWNPRIIPDTELRRELKMRALDHPVQFLLHFVSGNDDRVVFGDEHKLSTTAMYALFCDWLQANNVRDCNYTKRTFSLSINKIIKSKSVRIDGKVLRGYELDHELFMAALCKHLKMKPEELQQHI